MLGLDLPTIISLALTLVIAITVHEFSHAIVADNLGDPLPRSQGRITLNPLMHLDPFGSILFIATGFGWGRPVMTNPYNYRMRARTGMAIVAAAGPISNFFMALIAAIPFRLGLGEALNFFRGLEGFVPSLPQFLFVFISVNLGLMLFNLIPVSPLDGFKIAMGVLPDEWANTLAGLEQAGPILLFFLVILGRTSRFVVLGFFIGGPQHVVFLLNVGGLWVEATESGSSGDCSRGACRRKRWPKCRPRSSQRCLTSSAG
jgi:Zn-dependent protease